MHCTAVLANLCTLQKHRSMLYMQCGDGTTQRYSPQPWLRCSCLQFQVNCCWSPGVAPFLVGRLSRFLAHVHKSQRTSSVCLTLKKWKGSTIQPRDSLCVSHQGSKGQGESSSHSHSHQKLERSKHTQVYILLVSLFDEPH